MAKGIPAKCWTLPDIGGDLMDAKIAELLAEWWALPEDKRLAPAILLDLEERVKEMIEEKREWQEHEIKEGAA